MGEPGCQSLLEGSETASQGLSKELIDLLDDDVALAVDQGAIALLSCGLG